MSITHATVAVGTDAGTGEIHKAEWNAAHAIDGYTGYTPALTGSSSNPTLGSGSSAAGRYTQIGKHVSGYGQITFGSSGVSAGSGEYRISLPVTTTSTAPRAYGSCVLYDDSAATFVIGVLYHSSTTDNRVAIPGAALLIASSSQPWTWAANDALIFQFEYEAA